MWIRKEERKRIADTNPDYAEVIAQNKDSEKSFYEIRKELKLYLIEADKQYRILAKTRKEALEKLKKINAEIKAGQVTQIKVEYETRYGVQHKELKCSSQISKKESK